MKKNKIIEKITNIPQEIDWKNSLSNDLDMIYAYEQFFGKTNEQAKLIFINNPIEAADNLRWMPLIPFRYYMVSFADAILDGNFKYSYHPDAASCFINLVKEKLENNIYSMSLIMTPIHEALTFILDNQELYNLNPEIYGNLEERINTVLDLFRISYN